MAIDPKHLPEDPKILQQMVLDLMTQLDREFSERNKIESLLRELLDAKRNRKSEQLSADNWRCSRQPGRRGKRKPKHRRRPMVPMTRTAPSKARAQHQWCWLPEECSRLACLARAAN